MKANRVILIGAILWAAAFILSAAVFRGRVLGDWIEGLFLAAWIAFSSYWAAKSGRGQT